MSELSPFTQWVIVICVVVLVGSWVYTYWSRRQPVAYDEAVVIRGRCRHCGNDAGWFKRSHDECDRNYEATKSAVLDEASRGVVPRRFQSSVRLPVALDRGESVVWAFQGARYLDLQRLRRGGHSYGLSTRVARGIWYSERMYSAPKYDYNKVELGVGLLVITDRAIRFRSDDGTIVLRYLYASIDDLAVYNDGIGVHLQSRSTKPQQSTFICRDGQFGAQLAWSLWRRASAITA
jgi:hypothetical protein